MFPTRQSFLSPPRSTLSAAAREMEGNIREAGDTRTVMKDPNRTRGSPREPHRIDEADQDLNRTETEREKHRSKRSNHCLGEDSWKLAFLQSPRDKKTTLAAEDLTTTTVDSSRDEGAQDLTTVDLSRDEGAQDLTTVDLSRDEGAQDLTTVDLSRDEGAQDLTTTVDLNRDEGAQAPEVDLHLRMLWHYPRTASSSPALVEDVLHDSNGNCNVLAPGVLAPELPKLNAGKPSYISKTPSVPSLSLLQLSKLPMWTPTSDQWEDYLTAGL